MNPIQFRRHLHMHPELSFREHDTAAFISARLSELGIEHRPIAGTGVLAKIEGRGKADPKRRAVVLRADIDALPIDERNDADWSSRNQGVMHACGHDMHAAVLFGVLQQLAAEPDFRGTIFGLFQPGEECNPGGASLVLAENPFEGYDVRAVVGEHVEPQLEVGTLGFRAGKYMAASDELRFTVHGTGGHGAMRPQLKDPVAAAAEFVTRLVALNHEECVLSIGRVEAGGATNIVPDQVYLEGTLRTFDERNDADWSSRNQGVMHACGHDMHAAVLFGVLQQLAAEPDFRGTIFGLFQPGEECNPGGASLVLAENPFEGYDVRAVVGEHVEPQLEVGTLGFRAGKYMAASDELRFTVHGTGGHGAMRPQLKDPVAAAAEFVTRLVALNHEECVLSIGRVEAGGATNIVPDQVYLEGTLRTFDEREREIIHKRIRNFAADIDKRHGVRTDVDISRGYPCVVNAAALVKHAAALAAEAGLRVEMLPLRTTAEDFGFYCTKYPSLFYRLGVGAAAGRPHTATFNPDEGAIDTGIDYMKRLALQILKK